LDGCALATVFFGCGLAAVLPVVFGAATGVFGAGLGGAVDGTAAVVAAATSETHAISRFTQVSSYTWS
jgi:hypothetical protein